MTTHRPKYSRHHRRGMALLMVLGVLVLVMSVCASLAHLSSTERFRRDLVIRTTTADDLMIALEEPILHWLAKDSSSIVLPPHVQAPGFEILNDTFIGLDQDQIAIRIWAYDQRGMAPVQLLVAGSPMRLALPNHLHTELRAIDALDRQDLDQFGLDQLLCSDREHCDWLVFPRVKNEREETQSVDGLRGLAIGSFLASHNGLNGQTVSLNVNTAPIDLLETCMRLNGIGGIEQIIQLRSHGKPALAPHSARPQGNDSNHRIDFISSSDTWAFRIDIRVGQLTKSWWSIYSKQTTGQRRGLSLNPAGNNEKSHRGGWECVQRLAIPE